MAFCGKCGTKVDEGVKFCPSCGNPMEAPAPEQQAQTQQAQPAGDQNDFSAKIAALNNTADTTADFDKADIEQNKVMGILAYLSWLVLIGILVALLSVLTNTLMDFIKESTGGEFSNWGDIFSNLGDLEGLTEQFQNGGLESLPIE